MGSSNHLKINLDLNSLILSMGLKSTASDACAYIHAINGFDVTRALYVDDLIIACTDLHRYY